MKIAEISEIVDGTILCSAHIAQEEIESGFASDMMSDVLAYTHNQGILITGLKNPQVVRTAEMVDIKCILLVNGKQPDQDMINLANKMEIAFIVTKMSMFQAICELSKAGLCG